jgi:hypothetical protein
VCVCVFVEVSESLRVISLKSFMSIVVRNHKKIKALYHMVLIIYMYSMYFKTTVNIHVC